MKQTWRIVAQTRSSRWMEVPDHLEDPQAWSNEAARGLVGRWDSSGGAYGVEDMASLLLEAWSQKDATAMVNLLFWPVDAPLVGRVSIGVRRYEGVRDWHDRGYVLDEWNSENIGPGMRCVYMNADARRARFVASAFVFKRSSDAVVVSTAPMLPLMYDAMMPDLVRLVDTIEAVDSAGVRFQSESISAVTTRSIDTWMGESVE